MPPPFNKLKTFLNQQEGYSDDVYKDSNDIPTVGHGANLQSPEVEGHLDEMGIDKEKVLTGQDTLNPEEAALLQQKQIEDKKQFLENVRKKDFPNAKIESNQYDALLSMAYNSPQLIGPQLRTLLDQNKPQDVAKEILLRSNKNKEPGIQKRRIQEAEMYSGKDFPNVINNLSPEEITEIKNVINGIQNIHERNRVLEQYPFLKEFVPTRPYNKTFNK